MRRLVWWSAGLGAALLLLLRDKGRSLSHGPPHPGFGVISAAERDRRFGPLVVTERDDGTLEIVGDGPPLASVTTHAPPGQPQTLSLHVRAAASAQAVFDELQRRGLQLQDVGALNVRRARGKAFLSSHAYGTAIDVNARENPQGSLPTREMGEIAKVFARHGWYWGGWFSTPDPHHFEFLG